MQDGPLKVGCTDNHIYIYIPIGSMYGIFVYIWLIFMVNVGKYTIHGSYGIYTLVFQSYLVRIGVWIPKQLLRRHLGVPFTPIHKVFGGFWRTRDILWMFPKTGVPKMDGENNGKPYEQIADLEVPLFFGNTHIGPCLNTPVHSSQS